MNSLFAINDTLSSIYLKYGGNSFKEILKFLALSISEVKAYEYILT